MNIFYFKKRNFIFIVLLCIALIGLKFLNRGGRQDPITHLSFQFFSEIQTASVNFHRGLFGLLEKYLFLLNLRDENRALKEENSKLRIRQQPFEEIFEENERLRKTVNFSANPRFELLASEVISTDLLSKNQLLIINKGRSHGVQKFMGVLHPSGVVGYVFRASPHSSQVITLLHPVSSLPVRNRNSRVTGLITSSSGKNLIFDFLSASLFEDNNKRAFKPGDFIITMKSDQFPSGFLVGQVLPFFDSSQYSTPDIYVQPAVNFDSLEEVFVILKVPDRQNKTKEKDGSIN